MYDDTASRNNDRQNQIPVYGAEAAGEEEPRRGMVSLRHVEEYANINVRVGGWQAPFITMSLD